MQDASSLRIEQNLRYFLQNDESLRKLVENIFLAEEESRMHLSIDDVLEFVEEMAELVGGAPVLSKHIVEKIYVEALYMEKSGANRWAQNTGHLFYLIIHNTISTTSSIISYYITPIC